MGQDLRAESRDEAVHHGAFRAPFPSWHSRCGFARRLCRRRRGVGSPGGAPQAGATTGDTDLALSQPSNIVVDITSPTQTSAVVNYDLPKATDPDDPTPLPLPACTLPSGSTFSLGVTPVTCTVDLSVAVTAAKTQLNLDQVQLVSDQHLVLRDQAALTLAESALRQAVMQLEAAETTHADAATIAADQNAADADQTAADADLNAETIDQATADADQSTVNADQSASDSRYGPRRRHAG